MKHPHTAIASATALLLTLAAAPSTPAAAQYAHRTTSTSPATGTVRVPSTPGIARGAYVVVVDLDSNRLFFTRGRTVLWSAPVGTGTGFRLQDGSGDWEFSTPRGTFQVQAKAENPVWIAPDWYFVEHDQPIPPQDSPKRKIPGGLGAAAVYIGNGIAIHGTDKPELLGQRVSHGCIRLADRDARRLFHNVQVGTEVVIVGGERAPEPAVVAPSRGSAKKARAARAPRSTMTEPFLELLGTLETDELLDVLATEVTDARGSEHRWAEAAGVVLRRGLDGDRDALRGLLLGARWSRGAVGREYGTFLADAYARAPNETLRVLGGLSARDRRLAATAIAEASIALYPGDPSGRTAPWATRRIPRESLGSRARLGWDAIARAEAPLRESRRSSPRSADL